jgi:hypothetical protein
VCRQHVSDVQHADYGGGEEKNVLDFHPLYTPPLTRPSGPVQCRELNPQDRRACIPITPMVMMKRKISG